MIRQYVELVEERKKQVTTEKFPEAEEGAEIIQFSTAGGLAAQAKIIQEHFAKKVKK